MNSKVIKRALLGGVLMSTWSLYAAEPTNVVVLIADDTSFNDLGCYGNPVVKTPNIDAVAEGGIRFTNMFLTASSSSPSRASIMTGRYPHNTGACELHSPIGDEQVSLAGVLHDAGYYTGQAGKWHFGNSAAKPSGPFVEDFDRLGGSVLDGGGVSGAERWVEYLRERPKDKPFFFWFASHDAHRNWDDDQSMPRYDLDDIIVPKYYIDNEASRKDMADYYYEISRFDKHVGEVVQELKDQGVFDNTMIIILADNGRPFPRYKSRLISEGIKTFFIVSYPNATKEVGVECSSLASVIDLAPTVAEVAGTTSSERFQGRSFMGLLSDVNQPFRNYIFAEHNWHDYEALERMVCDGEYILIENRRVNLGAEGAIDIMGGGVGRSLLAGHEAGTLTEDQVEIFNTPRPSLELYAYTKDKEQECNLINKRKKKADQLLSTLRLWQEQTHDSYPDNISPDWYSRTTLEKIDDFGVRRDMPGADRGAKSVLSSGPF